MNVKHLLTRRQGKEIRVNYSRTKDLAAVCIIKVALVSIPTPNLDRSLHKI